MTAKSIDDLLKNLTVTVKVNAAKKLVSSVSITSKGTIDLSATLTPASDVSITPPKNPTKYQDQVSDLSKLKLGEFRAKYPIDTQHITSLEGNYSSGLPAGTPEEIINSTGMHPLKAK